MSADVEMKISRARAQLIVGHAFFASLLCSRPLLADESIPTACTNGVEIRYNPGFIKSLTSAEVLFLLCHEVLHMVLDHVGRRADRNPLVWNYAGDYIINDTLRREGIGALIQGCLDDPALVSRAGGTTDGVYNEIIKDLEKQGQGGGQGDGQDGQLPGHSGKLVDWVSDLPGTPEEQRAARAAVQVAVAQAAQAAKMCGQLSAGLARFVDAALTPVVRWQEVMQRFAVARDKSEVTYARPSRRMLSQGIYMPSRAGDRLGVIALAVDCSGSIGQAELNAFGAEALALWQDARPKELHVVYFDSKVSHHDVYEEGDEPSITAHGGGGTAFSPIFRFLSDRGVEPDACIVLTDLCCNDFGPAPSYPVLWVTNHSEAAPWGQVVSMKPQKV